MGLSRETYYGPFLVYKPVMEKVTRQIRGCGKCNTENSSLQVGFCGKCGSKHELFIREREREVDIFDGDLYLPSREGKKIRVAIPNMNEDIDEIREVGGYRDLELDQFSGEQIFEFTEPNRAINKFTEIFMKHIVRISDAREKI